MRFRDWFLEDQQRLLPFMGQEFEAPSVNTLNPLLPRLAAAAQGVYDAWAQDDEGFDDEYGGGGICHDIAEAMCQVLGSANIDSFSYHSTVGENHVWVIAKFREGVYSIDIPPSEYETGGGYTWKKIQGVRFTPQSIYVSQVSADPAEFDQYSEQ